MIKRKASHDDGGSHFDEEHGRIPNQSSSINREADSGDELRH